MIASATESRVVRSRDVSTLKNARGKLRFWNFRVEVRGLKGWRGNLFSFSFFFR